jgi:toxin ParE1/3/4
MSLRIVFRQAAKDELADAAAWYEERREDLGVEFLAEVGEAVQKAAENPQRYPAGLRDVRRTACRHFPYTVYLRTRAHSLVVLAVFHARRDPAVWQRRV